MRNIVKVTVLCSSSDHPINNWLENWIKKWELKCQIDLIRNKSELIGGDILFLISCSDIVSKKERDKYKNTLIIHASDLPNGRGWSPHVWEIINGTEEITLTLLEAANAVDSGNIWKKMNVKIPKTALYEQINKLIFDGELELMDFAVENFNSVVSIKQSGKGIRYWPKRTPADSEINIHKTISEQFDLIRVCDSSRFPAFFYKAGKKFTLRVEVADE